VGEFERKRLELEARNIERHLAALDRAERLEVGRRDYPRATNIARARLQEQERYGAIMARLRGVVA
jgi:hypothetical protein